MRKSTGIAFLFLVSLSTFPFMVSGQGFLRTKGPLIVNEKGEKVILRGMGLGGWMLQEGYMLRLGNLGQQQKIRAKIEELVGPEKTARFYDDWLENDVRKIDIDSMAAWGFNSIRLPMHYHLYTLSTDEEPVPGKDTWLEKGFALTDSLLSWCRADHIYLILDLHATPGGQGNDLPISDRDPSKPSLWDSEANQKKMIALWQRLAERYAHEPWIGGYDIINEPNWGFEDPNDRRGTAEKTNAPLRRLMMNITAAIREVDRQHIIIIEGNGFGNNYRGVLPPWDDNMVLSFHKYWNRNNEASIRGYLDLREKYNIPLWMGESGENANTWFTDAIQLAEDHDIGWSWWPLKKIGSNNPLEIPFSVGWRQLVDYWNGKGPRPSAEEAESALQQLAHDARLENNIYHKDVTDAMFRQVHTTATEPFIQHTIGNGETIIRAVDYDGGRQGYAYSDKDTGNYQGMPGAGSAGNRGHVYRNDGVDIAASTPASSPATSVTAGAPSASPDYYVFSIEDGEWLQYTIDVQKENEYTIGFTVASGADTSRLSLTADKTVVVRDLAIPGTGGPANWRKIEVEDIFLDKGRHVLRVYTGKGGFNLKAITIED